MKQILLDSRLSAVARFVAPNSVLADIGTDHAYLPCKLLSDGTITKAYAVDINPLPLERAKATAKKYGLTDCIHFVLCGGLEAFDEKMQDEITSIAIAGMGGEMIMSIIDNAPWIKNAKYNLILQPMTKADELRKYLCDNMFEIVDESACIAAGKHYTVINAKYYAKEVEFDELFLQIGKLKDKHDLQSTEYKQMIYNKLCKIANGIKHSEHEQNKATELIKLCEKIKDNIDNGESK